MLATLKTSTPSRPIITSTLSEKDLATEAAAWAEGGVTVRAVRGMKMATVPGLFDEFAAALQFPCYFGENWPAFDECLADLDWLPLTGAVVIVVYGAARMLQEASEPDVSTFFDVVARAAHELGEPIEDGEWWDRPGVAFHLVLQIPHEGEWPWRAGHGLWQAR